MSIERIGASPVRPLGREDRTEVEQKPDGESGSVSSRPDRADQVGLSAEGLALAEKYRAVEENLTPDRMARIEARIANGFYNDPSVAQVTASRIQASGDLDLIA